MALVLTEEQESIRKTAKDFVRGRAPIAHMRALRDTDDPTGFSRELWAEMAGLGLAGLILPEEYGGAGLGFAELGLVLEECGRALVPTPLLSTVVLGASAVLLAGSEAQKRAHLPGVASGERILALAHDEGTRHELTRVETRAIEVAGELELSGEKVFVLDGHVADAFVVSARVSGAASDRAGLALLLVPASAAGLTVTRTRMVDSRNAARVRFDHVRVPAAAALGTPGAAAGVLEQVLDRGAVALAAEMLGGSLEAFERTVAYLKDRKQFGVPIGSFQALKHRAAWMFCELELSKSIVLDALRAIDERRADAAEVASIAKARLADAFLLVSNEAVQMHGGVGVTDELDIGLFLKRARVAELSFGDAAHHRDRFARLRGY